MKTTDERGRRTGSLVGSHALGEDARPEPFSGHGALPRFGGEVGLTLTASEEPRRVVRVHPPRTGPQGGAGGR